MAYDFKKINELELVNEVPEGANVLIETDGATKRLPSTAINNGYSKKEVYNKAETDEKFLTKETIAKPDWNQNDPNAPDFVKNKPFYDNRKFETIFERTGIEGGRMYYEQFSFSLVPGDIYIVECSGEVYVCTAKWHAAEDVYIGNLSKSNEWGDVNTGENFFAATSETDNEIHFMYNCGWADEVHSLKITHCKLESELKQVEPVYLPNSVWVETSTKQIFDNYDTHASDEGFYAYVYEKNVLEVGDTVHITLEDPIEDYGYPYKASYELTAVLGSDGDHVYIEVENPDSPRIIWQCGQYQINQDNSYFEIFGNAYRRVTLSITKNTIKTNCDLMIKGNPEGCVLTKGDYYTALNKLYKGVPVSVFVSLSMQARTDNGTHEERYSDIRYASYYKDGGFKALYAFGNGPGPGLVIFPDNTVEFD